MYNENTLFMRLLVGLFVFHGLIYKNSALAQSVSPQVTQFQFIDLNRQVLKAKDLVLKDSIGQEIVYSFVKEYYQTSKKVFSIKARFDNKMTFSKTFKKGIFRGVFKFTIYPQNELMNAVIIGINKEKMALQNATVSTSILKPYLLQNKVTNTYSEILDQMPGISITDNQLNIRNGAGWSYGAGSRTLIAVDEIPLLSGDAGSAAWSFMPQEITAGAELIKSAGSVVYGSSALNGVLNLRTIEAGDKDKLSISSNMGFYSKPPVASQAYSNNPQTQTGLMGYYATRQKQNDMVFHWNFFNDDGYRLNEKDRRGRFGFKYKRNSKKIKGLSYGSNQSMQYGRSGSFLLWESGTLPYTSLDSGYNYTYGTRLAIDPYIVFHRRKSTHKLITRFFLVNNRVEDDNPNTDNSNGSSLLYTEYKFKHYLNSSFTINLGLVGMGSETSSPLYKGSQKNRNVASYAQLEYHKKRWRTGIGARYEYFEMGRTKVEKPVFRFGTNYKVAKATFLRGSIGQGFRFPSVAEAFTQTSVGPITVYANPELRPETSLAAEIGIKQGIQTKKISAFVDLALFQNTLDDMMEFTFGQWVAIPTPPESGYGFKSLNAGKGRVQGVEVEVMAQYKTRKYDWVLLAGYTFSDAKNLEPNKVIAIDESVLKKPLTFNNTRSDSTLFLKYRYKHLYKFDWQYNRHSGWMVGLSARYMSKMENIDAAFQGFPINLFIPGVLESRPRMGNALIFDLRAGFEISEHFWINGQIRNVLNTAYYGRPADIQDPRLFQIQVKYSI